MQGTEQRGTALSVPECMERCVGGCKGITVFPAHGTCYTCSSSTIVDNAWPRDIWMLDGAESDKPITEVKATPSAPKTRTWRQVVQGNEGFRKNLKGCSLRGTRQNKNPLTVDQCKALCVGKCQGVTVFPLHGTCYLCTSTTIEDGPWPRDIWLFEESEIAQPVKEVQAMPIAAPQEKPQDEEAAVEPEITQVEEEEETTVSEAPEEEEEEDYQLTLADEEEDLVHQYEILGRMEKAESEHSDGDWELLEELEEDTQA